MLIEGVQTCTLAAGKGDCDLSNGFDAGTVDIDASNNKITFNIDGMYFVDEYHVSIPHLLVPQAEMRRPPVLS